MLWIGSFPRSGVTFLRIVLHEIYGMESSTYHLENAYPVDPGYERYPAVKTHLLPHELQPSDPSIPAIYLVRDGRDSLVSMAHQRSDIVAPDSDYYENLREAILAAGGSYFGGWSRHVRLWRERAPLILRFEELVADPIACIERIRAVFPLPEPRLDRLPSFDDLKNKDFRYGSGVDHGFSDQARKDFRQKFFRRGKVGAWRDEMPEDLHRLFLDLHGEVLDEMGYFSGSDLTLQDLPELSFLFRYAEKCGGTVPDSFCTRRANLRIEASPCAPAGARAVPAPKPISGRVLIEGWRLLSHRMDGAKRYILELLKGLRQDWGPLWDLPMERPDVEFFVHMGGNRVLNILDDALSPYLSATPGPDAVPDFPLPEGACPDTIPVSGTLWSSRWKELRFNLNHALWQKELKRKKQGRSGPFDFDILHLTSTGSYHVLTEDARFVLATIHGLTHLESPNLSRRSADVFRNRCALHALTSCCDTFFITASKDTRRGLLTAYEKILPGRVFHIPEGCDSVCVEGARDRTEIGRVKRACGISSERYLLAMGSLDPRKNLDGMLEAFHRLVSQDPDLDVTLVVTGLTREDLEGKIDPKLISSSRVRLPGLVPDGDLSALYSGATALCDPCHYGCAGFSAIEAMACGVPVIHGRKGSLPGIVCQGGVSVDTLDVGDIAHKMKLMTTNDELRAALVRGAIKRSSCYLREKMVLNTLHVYHRVLLDRD